MTREVISIALLTHAPSDLPVLVAARAQLPDDFAAVQALDLQQYEATAQLLSAPQNELASAHILLSCECLAVWGVCRD